MKKRILLVEDDPHIRLGICEALTMEGYTVLECSDGSQVAGIVKKSNPDLILLDIMLPGKSGYEACRELRLAKDSTPIIMLTAKGQEIDKVVGLELGADDYVTKPFGLRELLARVQAVLRRTSAQSSPQKIISELESIQFGHVQINTHTLRGINNKKAIEFSPRELKVLTYLYTHAGEAISRDRLLNHVWGIHYYGTTRTLDQVIVKLRQKIEDVPTHPKHLQTVHGLGYRLDIK